MAKKSIFSLFLIFATACFSPDYAIVTGESETVYVEVEVPGETVYVEVEVEVEGEVEYEHGEIWVDHFVQPLSVDGVDILWVIDTSGSMYRYDPELMAGIEAMMNALPESGWRLAMMSNDPGAASIESQFPLVPGDNIADAVDMYNAMGRGHREEGFDAAYEYIVNNSYASTWLRPDAALLVVFVSDEEDQSDDHFPDVADFKSWFASQRSGSAYVASVVNVAQADSVCTSVPSIINIGDRYMDVTNHFGGIVVDICSEDWSTGVQDASTQVEPHEMWELTYLPSQEETIRVFIDGLLNWDWHYQSSDNTVQFDVIPGGNSLVEIAYHYDPDDPYGSGSGSMDTGDTGDTGN